MKKTYYVNYSVGTTVTIDIPEDADPEDEFYENMAESEAYSNVATPTADIEEVLEITVLD